MSQKKLQLHMAWKEKRRQQQLKAQYGIDRPDVVVVERKNVFVITLRVILHAAYIALRICASCAVAVLAIIGLASGGYILHFPPTHVVRHSDSQL